MKAKLLLVLLCLGSWGSAYAAGLNMAWAYHDDNDGLDQRGTEVVPGEGWPFAGQATNGVSTSEPVTLYFLTANQFAGDAEELTYLRWWNGEAEHWIQGEWVKNIHLGEGENSTGFFHGRPHRGDVMVDLWKVVVGPEVTRPGQNYYVIQLKAQDADGAVVHYLIRTGGEEFEAENDLGQAWTASPDYAGKDWAITIAGEE